MKILLNKLLTLLLFLVAIGCFYLTVTMTFASSFVNFALFFIAIFFLVQACGMFDKTQGYGKYSVKEPEAKKDDDNDEKLGASQDEQETIMENDDYEQNDYD